MIDISESVKALICQRECHCERKGMDENCVEKWECRIITKYTPMWVELLAPYINQAKQEVAKEIFDTIEKHLNEFQWTEKPDYSKRHYPYCPSDFYELKAKYLKCYMDENGNDTRDVCKACETNIRHEEREKSILVMNDLIELSSSQFSFKYGIDLSKAKDRLDYYRQALKEGE